MVALVVALIACGVAANVATAAKKRHPKTSRKAPRKAPLPAPDLGPFVVAGTAWQGVLRGDADVSGNFSARVDAIGGHAAGSLSGSLPGGLFSCALKGPVAGYRLELRCRGIGMQGLLTLTLSRERGEGRFEGVYNGKPLVLNAAAKRRHR